jgi:hypothetical protein
MLVEGEGDHYLLYMHYFSIAGYINRLEKSYLVHDHQQERSTCNLLSRLPARRSNRSVSCFDADRDFTRIRLIRGNIYLELALLSRAVHARN